MQRGQYDDEKKGYRRGLRNFFEGKSRMMSKNRLSEFFHSWEPSKSHTKDSVKLLYLGDFTVNEIPDQMGAYLLQLWETARSRRSEDLLRFLNDYRASLFGPVRNQKDPQEKKLRIPVSWVI